MSKVDDLVKEIAEVIYDKKGEDILILKIGEVHPLFDYFVITTAYTEEHARAIAGEIEKKLKEKGIYPHHIEGYEEAKWVILDYWDIVVHIFLGDLREFYDLESLWGDVPSFKYPSENEVKINVGEKDNREKN